MKFPSSTVLNHMREDGDEFNPLETILYNWEFGEPAVGNPDFREDLQRLVDWVEDESCGCLGRSR